jgi:hypothetical protein
MKNDLYKVRRIEFYAASILIAAGLMSFLLGRYLTSGAAIVLTDINRSQVFTDLNK